MISSVCIFTFVIRDSNRSSRVRRRSTDVHHVNISRNIDDITTTSRRGVRFKRRHQFVIICSILVAAGKIHDERVQCGYFRLLSLCNVCSATNGVIAATSASSKAAINADMGIKIFFLN